MLIDTDFAGAQILGAVAQYWFLRFADPTGAVLNGMEGRIVVRPSSLPRRENL